MARGRMTRGERHRFNVMKAQQWGFQPVPVPGYPGLVVKVQCPACSYQCRPSSREAMQRHLQLKHGLVIRLGRQPIADQLGLKQLVDVVVPADSPAALQRPWGTVCAGCCHLGNDLDPHLGTCPGAELGPASSWTLRTAVPA